mmetsp:Transcript_31488/g.93900  ORF Transcript_31488/g.93900 Transcript_31488/m.93900 type:complete len:792 (-) Transcript_31488:2155-4530(-)
MSAPAMPPGSSPPLLGKPSPLGLDGGFTIAILAIALVLMAGDWVRPDINFLTTMAIYTAARFITVREAAAGFSNTGLLSVMALFAVAAGVARTGGLERIIRWTTGREKHHTLLLVRMLGPVMIASAFLNNTPIVSVLIPIVMTWSRRNGVSPKAILVCLSYCAIMGGTCTLIGTSTNLVIAGFQASAYPDDPRLADQSIFSITPYGISYAAWGFLFMMLFSQLLLSGARSPVRATELLVGLLVPKGSRSAGASVASAGLRQLDGVYLVSITRGDTTLHAVGPETMLQEYDVLSFAGDLTKMESISIQFGLPIVNSESDAVWETEMGLPPASTHADARRMGSPGQLQRQGGDKLVMRAGSVDDGSGALPVRLAGNVTSPRFIKATLKAGSSLVGLTVRQATFGMRFSAAVVSLPQPPPLPAGEHRSESVSRTGTAADVGGESSGSSGIRRRNGAKLADTVLLPGHRLLLDVGPNFDPSEPAIKEHFEDVHFVGDEGGKEYTAAFTVKKTIAGKTIKAASLDGIAGVTLNQLDTADGQTIHAVASMTMLQEGDVLWFSGDVEGLTFLFGTPGLEHFESEQVKKAGIADLERRLVQVVVAMGSPLIGCSVRESRFRTKYNAAIIGVHRRGKRLRTKIGDIVLAAGDVLLLDAGETFLETHGDSNAFSLISEVPSSTPVNASRMWLAIGLFAAMIAVQIAQSFAGDTWINFWTSALLTTALMLLTRCMTWEQAKSNMDWTIFITIASAFGVSQVGSETLGTMEDRGSWKLCTRQKALQMQGSWKLTEVGSFRHTR